MKIISFKMKGFKRFRLANIDEIEIDITKPITIITAANGYGKSSLIRELCPLPSTRTDFEPDGYKILTIEHNKSEYILSSSFAERKPHSFIMNGEELNVGGTTDVQEELCEKHFGITPLIRNIIYGKIKVCNLSRAERKNLFLKVSNLNIEIALDTYKKTITELKNIKACLQHLYKRKVDIEGRLIPEDTLKKHTETLTKYQQDANEYTALMSKLETVTQSIYSQLANEVESTIEVEDIFTAMKNIVHHARQYTNIPRDDKQAYGNAILAEITKYKTEQLMLIEEMNNVGTKIVELQKDEANAKDIDPERGIELKKAMQKLNEDISGFGVLTEHPIPQNQLMDLSEQVSEIGELCTFFSLFKEPKISISDLDTKIRARNDYSTNLASLTKEQSLLQSIIDDQKKELIALDNKATIPDACNFDSCGLKQLYGRKQDILSKSLFENTQKLTNVENQMKSFDEKLQASSNELEAYESERYREQLNRLSQLLNRNSYFGTVLEHDLLVELQNPSAIQAKVQRYVEESKNYWYREKLYTEKSKLESELYSLAKAGNLNAKFIIEQINEYQDKLGEMADKLQAITGTITTCDLDIRDYKDYSTDIELVNSMTKQFETLCSETILKNNLKFAEHCRSKTTEQLATLRSNIDDLDRIVREQNELLGIYNDILLQITDLEKNKVNHEHIEIALSPTSGLIHRSMVEFLNGVVENVNRTLESIWSYPLALNKFDEDSELTYDFKVTMGTHDVAGDISQMSDGQTEIINLAFTIQLLAHAGVLNSIPFFTDEIGRTFDSTHRGKILSLLESLILTCDVPQIFVIHHSSLLTQGFVDSDIIHLGPIETLPDNANEHVKLKYKY